MIEIRKVSGNKNFHVVNIPYKYIKAMGLDFGDMIELYMVDNLTLVMKIHNMKPARGLKAAAEAPAINV